MTQNNDFQAAEGVPDVGRQIVVKNNFQQYEKLYIGFYEETFYAGNLSFVLRHACCFITLYPDSFTADSDEHFYALMNQHSKWAYLEDVLAAMPMVYRGVRVRESVPIMRNPHVSLNHVGFLKT